MDIGVSPTSDGLLPSPDHDTTHLPANDSAVDSPIGIKDTQTKNRDSLPDRRASPENSNRDNVRPTDTVTPTAQSMNKNETLRDVGSAMSPRRGRRTCKPRKLYEPETGKWIQR